MGIEPNLMVSNWLIYYYLGEDGKSWVSTLNIPSLLSCWGDVSQG